MGKNRLLWIRGLMLLSMAMLLVLLSSWLITQYSTQKAQLTSDLNLALEDAHESLMDSIVHAIAIDSALIDPVVAIDQVHRRHVSKLNRGKGSPVFIRSTKIDSAKYKKLEYRVSKLNKVKSDTVIFSNNDEGIIQTTIRYDSDTITNIDHSKVVEPMLKVIFKSLVSSDEFSDQFKFDSDSLQLRNAFNNELKLRDWNFFVYWNQQIKNVKGNLIYLDNHYFGKVFPVAIGGYHLYLLKKITPQILFTVFLLIVTSAAFLFTYNTLREQIRLGTLKNEFISNMSHELKTPVSTVKVALEAINNFEPITDTTTVRDYLRMATLETERLEMLINQSLNVSMMEQGRIILHKEPYEIKLLIDKTLQAMQVRLKQAGAEVHINNPPASTTANIDVLHMQGAVINLLDNSLKYSHTLPVINIDIATHEGNIILTIADNGPGIPAEYRDKVFDKFFRVPSGDRHNVKGYGLGLSYVMEVITQHDGSVKVDNLNKGCVFTIKIPSA